MGRSFVAWVVLALAVAVWSITKPLSADPRLTSAVAGVPLPSPLAQEIGGGAGQWRAADAISESYASYYWYWRSRSALGRPYRRYVYRCRRFSFQCARYPVRRFGYGAGYAARYQRVLHAAAPPDPARLGRRSLYPELRDWHRFDRDKGGAEGLYDGRRVGLIEASGGFVRVASPGRSARWVRAGAVIAD